MHLADVGPWSPWLVVQVARWLVERGVRHELPVAREAREGGGSIAAHDRRRSVDTSPSVTCHAATKRFPGVSSVLSRWVWWRRHVLGVALVATGAGVPVPTTVRAESLDRPVVGVSLRRVHESLGRPSRVDRRMPLVTSTAGVDPLEGGHDDIAGVGDVESVLGVREPERILRRRRHGIGRRRSESVSSSICPVVVSMRAMYGSLLPSCASTARK